MVKNNNETLSWKWNEDWVELSQVQKKHQIEVPEDLLKDFGEVLVWRNHIKKIENWTLSTKELSKLKLEQFKWTIAVEQVSKNINKAHSIEKKWDIELKESAAIAKEKLKKKIDKMWNSNAWKKTKEVFNKAKEKVWASSFFGSMFEGIKNLWNKIWWIWWSFLKILMWWFGGMKWWLGLWKKAKEVVEKLKPEEIENTKNEVKKSITQTYSKLPNILPNHPVIDTNIEAILNDPEIFSEDALRALNTKIKAWEKVDIKSIKWILKTEEYEKLKKTLFNPEIRNALMLKAEHDIVEKIQKNYNLSLNSEKRGELVKLINEEKWESDFLELSQAFIEWEEVSGFNVLWATFSTWVQLAMFGIKLVSKWIIGAWDLALDVKDVWVEAVEVSLSWLWLKGQMTFDNFQKQLEGMNSAEKWLLLWVMYRKTWFFARVIWNVWWFLSKNLVNLVTPTGVDSLKMLKDSSLWDINKQIDNFQKLSEPIAWMKNPYLITAKDNLNKLVTNAEIIRILDVWEKSGKTWLLIKKEILALKNVNGIDKNLINSIKELNANNLDDLRKWISNKIHFSMPELKWLTWLKKLYPWFTDAVLHFSKNIDSIVKYQKAKVLWRGSWQAISRTFKKHDDIMAHLKLSRNTDKLIFEWLSKEKTITRVKALKKFSQDFPDIFKHTFWGIAEIAFIWLSLSTKEENESFLEVIGRDFLYMSWLIWPLTLIFSASAILDKDKNIQWFNVAGAWVGTVLLGMDTATSIAIFGSNWFTGTAIKKIGLNVVLRPITASWKSIVYLGKWWKNIIDIIRGKWWLSFMELWKQSLGKMKWKKWKLALAILWVSILWYAAINYFRVDLSEEFKELEEKWIIDKKWNILKPNEAQKYFTTELSDWEKQAFIEIIFIQKQDLVEVASNLKFDLKSDKLTIIAENKHIWKWIITPEIEKYLKQIWIKEIDFQNNIQIN
jgi:hypothetical protein